MIPGKQNKLLSLFILSLALRLIWIFIAGSHTHPQIWEYEVLANNLLDGRGFVCTHLGTVYKSFASPLYPFLCAFVYLITNHSYTILLIAQACISSLVCVLIYKAAKDIFDHYTAILASVSAVMHPGLIVYTSKLHPLVLDTFLIILVAFLFLRIKINLSLKYAISTGIASGLCILTRSTIAMFLPFGLLWLFFASSHNKRKICYYVILIIFSTVAVVLPWIIRNFLVQGKFIFMQTTSQEAFWRGNNIYATGSSHSFEGKIVLEAIPHEVIVKIYSLDEIGQSDFFHKEAFKFIRQYPKKAIGLFFRKLYYFWWFSPTSGIEYPKIYLMVYRMLYLIVFLFGVYGLLNSLSSSCMHIKDKAYLLFMLFVTISIAQSFFYVEGRHRWTLEPLFIIFSVNGFMKCLIGILTGSGTKKMITLPEKVIGFLSKTRV